MKAKTLVLAGLFATFLAGMAEADEWPAYGRDVGGTRFSPLMQVTPENVAQLKPVWTFRTGDMADGKGGTRRSGFNTTPLLMSGRLYLTTAFNRVIALDPVTGRQLWVFDPHIDKTWDYGDGLINRGLAAWRSASTGSCAIRLFEATEDARLIALDAATGLPCADFGNKGEVDLKDVPNYRNGWYHMSSPPLVLDGVVIVGSAINDNPMAEMPDGVVRGFDARTGKLLWKWEPLEGPATVSPENWHTGAGNAWSILSADPEHHLVYVPTGSASPDYYGGLRPGDNRWADSVVALDSRSGKLIWGFQLVHHDLWDYDTAAAPLLTTLSLNGRRMHVLIAGNKTGMVYVLDPTTGKPVLPVEERPVPQSNVPGEVTSPTQPFSTLPALARQTFPASDIRGLSATDRAACEVSLSALSGTSIFSPPSLQGALVVPGIIGGINWSGFAWDAAHERLIVAVSNLPYRAQLIPADQFASGTRGDIRGNVAAQRGTPYAVARGPFMAPSGKSCVPPPWGELVALDLAAGKIAWRQPLGTMSELFSADAGTGSVILGGPIVTAGGVIFAGGTLDRRFHALSAETGKELWSAELPASAHAQPMTYEIGGKQYVVVAAGGSSQISEEVIGDSSDCLCAPLEAYRVGTGCSPR